MKEEGDKKVIRSDPNSHDPNSNKFLTRQFAELTDLLSSDIIFPLEMGNIVRRTCKIVPIIVISLMALTMVTHAASKLGSTESSTNKSSEAQTKTKDVSSGDATFVYKQASKSVVTIEAISGDTKIQGSGVVYKNGVEMPQDRSIEEVSSDPSLLIPRHSWIISSSHVVKNATRVSILHGGQRYQGLIKYADDDLDLAIIFMEDVVIPPSTVKSSSQVAVGDKVFSIGSPLGLESSITEGILSGKRERNGVLLLQTTAPISKGSSGGGLFDGKAGLIGILSFKLSDGENINFAVYASYIDQIDEAYMQAAFLRLTAEEWGGFSQSAMALINSHAFIKWLLNERDANGERLYIVAKKDMEEHFKKQNISFSYKESEEFLRSQVQFVKRFVAKRSGLSSPQQEAKDDKVTLICSTFTKSGERRDFVFSIDFVSRTVNGHRANISDDEIRWKKIGKDGVTEYSSSINRYTGLFSVGTRQFPFLMSGKCTRSTERQF